jgi:uncharacterized surface protein with fasciclin (FAS1) repeats
MKPTRTPWLLAGLTLTSLSATLVAAPAQAAGSGKDYQTTIQWEQPRASEAAALMPETVVSRVQNSPTHTTLAKALKAGDLVEVLSGPGPFTFLAPTNAAFDQLPDGSLAVLLKPENKNQLIEVLQTHVVKGQLTSKKLKDMLTKGKGTAELMTLNGGRLHMHLKDGQITILDPQGHRAVVKEVDLKSKNGVVHVIDTVLLPVKK